jgi:hypothetical protein
LAATASDRIVASPSRRATATAAIQTAVATSTASCRRISCQVAATPTTAAAAADTSKAISPVAANTARRLNDHRKSASAAAAAAVCACTAIRPSRTTRTAAGCRVIVAAGTADLQRGRSASRTEPVTTAAATVRTGRTESASAAVA